MTVSGSMARRRAGIAHGGAGPTPDRKRRRAAGLSRGARGRPIGRFPVPLPSDEDVRVRGASDDEIDPAFDEYGDLADHVDGLSARVRRVRCLRNGDDPWAATD